MTGPIAPQFQEAIPQDMRGPADELYLGLRNANEARRAGVPPDQLDGYLLDRYGMTYKALAAAVKSMPKEIASNKPLTTKMILKAEAYGATAGWSDNIAGIIGALKGTGYSKAKKAAQNEMREFEHDYPWLARAAKAYGLGAAAIGGGLAGRGAIAFGAGRGISAATLAGSDAPMLGAAGRAAVGAGLGAAAGAGGMLGEGSPGQNMAQGALMGGLGGAGMAAPALSRVVPLLGAASAGAYGKKLLGWLAGQK